MICIDVLANKFFLLFVTWLTGSHFPAPSLDSTLLSIKKKNDVWNSTFEQQTECCCEKRWVLFVKIYKTNLFIDITFYVLCTCYFHQAKILRQKLEIGCLSSYVAVKLIPTPARFRRLVKIPKHTTSVTRKV